MSEGVATGTNTKKSLNLILCSDGTGNKGGSTPDTNVFKVFNAVDIHNECVEQRTFYDVGIGTSELAIWKTLSGAFGLGFRKNVKDLYRFLAKNFDPDREVKIFLFGFSRGAATVRAFTGFLHACGLLDGRGVSAGDLRDGIDKQFKLYLSGQPSEMIDKLPGVSHGRIPIHFVGVWDTVSALGAPKWGKPTGPLSWLMKMACLALDYIANLRSHHHSYQYGLNENIKNAYHALAIDDERTSFRPMVWNEIDKGSGNVEQVWFAGMHSNVGGGYEREGLADVALEWMVERAERHDLRFNRSDLREIHERSNSHGLIRDSRAGAAIFYRYHPRIIEELCEGRLVTQPGALEALPRIHTSVIERMEHRVDEYAPGYLPGRFHVVTTELKSGTAIGCETLVEVPPSDGEASAATRGLKRRLNMRKGLYSIMIFALLVAFVWGLILWFNPPTPWGRSGFFEHVADILDYVFPDLLAGLVERTVVQSPIYFTVFALGGFLGAIIRYRLVRRMRLLREELRKLVLKYVPNPSNGNEVSS